VPVRRLLIFVEEPAESVVSTDVEMFQPGGLDDRFRQRTATFTPSTRSSPWTRRYPQVLYSRARRRTSQRIDRTMRGRPTRRGRERRGVPAGDQIPVPTQHGSPADRGPSPCSSALLHHVCEQFAVHPPVSQDGFSPTRRSTRVRIERTVCGRPRRRGHDAAAWRWFCRSRCQRSTVSGPAARPLTTLRPQEGGESRGRCRHGGTGSVLAR
jgi:hypothetical protein